MSIKPHRFRVRTDYDLALKPLVQRNDLLDTWFDLAALTVICIACQRGIELPIHPCITLLLKGLGGTREDIDNSRMARGLTQTSRFNTTL